MVERSYERPEELILDQQATLLRFFYKLVAGLTAVSILLIVFLPGFATSEDVLEPFVRNVVIFFIIGILYMLVVKGHVLASIYGMIGTCTLVASYSVYIESPGNMQMMALLIFPTCLAGFLPKRTEFWIVYGINFALMLTTVWLIIEFKGVELEYRSVATLGMLITLFALLIDTLSTSYRESLITTFSQLQKINAAEERLSKLDQDLGVAVSERIQAEAVSDQLESTGRLALEVAGAGAIAVNLVSGQIEVSPDFFSRYIIEPRPNTLTTLFECIHPEDRPRFELLFQQNIATGDRLEGDFRIASDTMGYWLFMLEAGLNGAGEKTLHGITVDVTSRVLEQQRQVAEGSKRQESQRLESLGVMAGAIAHDFNNLLHVIMLNADLAKQDLNPDSQSATSIDRVMTTVDRAAELCSELLAYSGKGNFTIEPFDIESLVSDMRSLLEISTPKGVTITFSSDASNPTIRGDITQIRQVILNLITNAGEALDNTGGNINIEVSNQYCNEDFIQEKSLTEKVAPGNFVRISVEDNGCGMDEKTMQRMFDPFFSTKETGHGLGLSAVLGIVRGHNGAIDIESTIGKGTTATLLLPVSDNSIEVPRPKQHESQATPEGGVILFADDEPGIRDLGRVVLEQAGYEVVLAKDGLEAISQFEQHRDRLHLVILDLMMPNKTGLEAYLEISALDASVPVVFSSGFNESEALDNLPPKTRSAFLKKPYLANDLLQFVLQVIGPGS
jgi:signal transduction histidine kinase/CheY-like chemotaxis protein